MSLRQTVMSGLRWSAGMRLLGQLLTWTSTLIVIRLLSPGDYGLMSMAGVFIAFLSMISEMGLGTAIVQRRDLGDNDLRAIFGFAILVTLVICCILIISAPAVSRFYGEPELVPILRVLSLIFVFSVFSVVPSSLLLKDLEYKKFAAVQFAGAIAGSACTLPMALLGFGVWSLVCGFLAVRIGVLVGVLIARPYLRFPTLRLKGMGPVFLYSGQVTSARILWYLAASAAATLIIGRVLGSELLGIYAVGLTLAALPMEKVGGILNAVAFPAFSSVQGDPNLAGAHFLRAVRILCLITVPVFFGISSVSTEIVAVFLGDRWLQAVVPLQIIAVMVPLRMVKNLSAPALMGMGRADVFLTNEVLAVVMMPLGFLVGSQWGVVGVSLVWMIVFPVVATINLFKTTRVLDLTLVDVGHQVSRSLLSGLVMYLFVVVSREFACTDDSVILNMLTLISVGAVVYFGMTMAINRSTMREAIGLVRS
ncbi:lipopolysaccharide biosynthesis protein [Gemmatimonadota bacterium]